jgi:hypothetical protein
MYFILYISILVVLNMKILKNMETSTQLRTGIVVTWPHFTIVTGLIWPGRP